MIKTYSVVGGRFGYSKYSDLISQYKECCNLSTDSDKTLFINIWKKIRIGLETFICQFSDRRIVIQNIPHMHKRIPMKAIKM